MTLQNISDNTNRQTHIHHFCILQLLLCSLYEIYQALEEELDRNCDHPAVQPIYFPQELARLESLEQDLEHFFGPQWRKKISVPAATHRYTQRLREVCLF